MGPEQLKILAEKYIAGNADEAEQRYLHDWYDAVHSDEPELAITPDKTDAKEFGAAMWTELLEHIKRENVSSAPAAAAFPEPVTPVRSFRRRGWMAAAVVILLAGTFSYLIFYKNGHRNAIPATLLAGTNDVAAPRAANATLQLADGTLISLQEAKAGVLARQGNTDVAKSGNGELIYSSGSPAGTNPPGLLYNTLTVPRGSRVVSLVLTDGTRVWLNAASSIRYPSAFAGNERKVEVTGEAYFEVARQPTAPFVVKAADVDLKVLGTSFNIHAYAEESHTVITLVEGSVQLSKKGGIRILKPGQQALADRDGDLQIGNDADLEQVLAWKNGLFQFHNASLDDIMRQAARWYDLDVRYEGDVRNQHFVGKVPRTVNASDLFALLELTKSVQFIIQGNTVTVQPYKKQERR